MNKKKRIMMGVSIVLMLMMVVSISVVTKKQSNACFGYFKRVKMSKCVMSLEKYSYNATGKEIRPEVTITYQGEKLVENVDYRLEYDNNVNGPKATIKAIGMNGYRGKSKIYFNIIRVEIGSCEIYLEKNEYDWDGKEKTPKVTIVYKGTTLEENADYTVSYRNNVDAGKGKVILNGLRFFKGTAIVEFKINGIDINDCDFKMVNGVLYPYYDGVVVDPAFYTYDVIKEDPRIDKVTNDTVKYIETTTYKLTGKGKFYGVYVKDEIKRTEKKRIDIAFASVKLDKDDYIYTGEAIQPKVTVSYKGKILVEGKDYNVNYSDNVEVGIGKITIQGLTEYCGTNTKFFFINEY